MTLSCVLYSALNITSHAYDHDRTECLYSIPALNVPISILAVDETMLNITVPQVECLNWILDNGGSVLDRDNLGGTPVHDAAEQGQVSFASCKYLS